MSQNVPVKLAEDPNNRRLWQIDTTSGNGFEVVRGFSGAPLLDEAGTVIWGMVIEVDAKRRPVAFAIGAELLYEAWRRIPRKMGVIVYDVARSALEETRKLQEQVLRLNTEREAALRELEVLRSRLRSNT